MPQFDISKPLNVNDNAEEVVDTSSDVMFDVGTQETPADATGTIKVTNQQMLEDIRNNNVKEVLAGLYQGFQAEYGNQEDIPYMLPRVAFKEYVADLINKGARFKSNDGSIVELKEDDLTNDISTYGSDILSMPGRGVGAVIDEIFSLGDASGVRSMANVSADDPLFYENTRDIVDKEGNIVEVDMGWKRDATGRNIGSNILQSMLRDPALLPTAVGSYGADKLFRASKFGKGLMGKMDNIPGIKSVPVVKSLPKHAPLAVAESALYEGVSNALSSDANPYQTTATNLGTDVGTNLLLSSLLGSGLARKAKNKWDTEFGHLLKNDQAIKKYQPVIDDVYTLNKPGLKGEYDLQGTIEGVNAQTKKLGQEKGELFKELDDHVRAQTPDIGDVKVPNKTYGEGVTKPTVKYNDYLLAKKAADDVYHAPTREMMEEGVNTTKDKIRGEMLSHDTSIPTGEKLLKYVDEYDNKYMKGRRKNLITNEIFPSDQYLSNLEPTFKSRRSLDTDFSSMYKKNPGAQFAEKDRAAMEIRGIMNDVMDAKVEKISSVLDGIDATKSNKYRKTFEDVQDLQNLYRQQEVMQSIGGGSGNFYRTSPYRMGGFNPGQTLLPASGIRERQISALVNSSLGQSLLQPLLQNTNPIGDED